ncbi:MAG: hypothetical protein KTR13_09735 [Saprospiraceae bacterium]|nr:hypothetical protein [Saprospiraceae bacterium]
MVNKLIDIAFELIRTIASIKAFFRTAYRHFLCGQKWYVNRHKKALIQELAILFEAFDHKQLPIVVSGDFAKDGLYGQLSKHHRLLELSYLDNDEQKVLEIFKDLGYRLYPQNFHKTAAKQSARLMIHLFCWRKQPPASWFLSMNGNVIETKENALNSYSTVELEGLQFRVPHPSILVALIRLNATKPYASWYRQPSTMSYSLKMEVYEYSISAF